MDLGSYLRKNLIAPRKFASQLGISPKTLFKWLEIGVPRERRAHVHMLTNGEVQFEEVHLSPAEELDHRVNRAINTIEHFIYVMGDDLSETRRYLLMAVDDLNRSQEIIREGR